MDSRGPKRRKPQVKFVQKMFPESSYKSKLLDMMYAWTLRSFTKFEDTFIVLWAFVSHLELPLELGQV